MYGTLHNKSVICVRIVGEWTNMETPPDEHCFQYSSLSVPPLQMSSRQGVRVGGAREVSSTLRQLSGGVECGVQYLVIYGRSLGPKWVDCIIVALTALLIREGGSWGGRTTRNFTCRTHGCSIARLDTFASAAPAKKVGWKLWAKRHCQSRTQTRSTRPPKADFVVKLSLEE